MGQLLRAETCTFCPQPTYCQWRGQPVCTLCLFEHILTKREPT